MSVMKEHIRDIISELKVSTNYKDISDAIEDLENATKELERREKVIQIIETLALESSNPNIIALREELFTTVKLIHSEQIRETLSKMEEGSSSLSFNSFSPTITSSGTMPGMFNVGTADEKVDTLVDTVYTKNRMISTIRKLLRMND